MINVSLRGSSLVHVDAAAYMIAKSWKSSHPDECPTVSSPLAGWSFFIPLHYWKWDFSANTGRKYVSPISTILHIWIWSHVFLDLMFLRSAHILAMMFYNTTRGSIWKLFLTSYFTNLLFSFRWFWNLPLSKKIIYWIMEWGHKILITMY